MTLPEKYQIILNINPLVFTAFGMFEKSSATGIKEIDTTTSFNSEIGKERCIMVKVTVTVDFQGKSYQTNVLTKPDTDHEVILQQALHQVEKQWKA
ncbi:BA3454 family stress response protein [Peribacillus simplex]|uniref:BA3454 family stress response protein n=1 Tax=Peribacillus simplex TaxID=1478 RepID=UPI0024C1B00B|nr:BA3454 family stress response protein [Peribacillus simplex]WHY57228.1 BA3454 family stress response protein [Peribacillus simplex]